MKIGDPKVQRTLRKQKVRGLLQDKKVPGTNTGTRASLARPASGLLGESQINGPLPFQTRPEVKL